MTSGRVAVDLLHATAERNNSLVCCGLDPDILRMPSEFQLKGLRPTEQVRGFLEEVVEITAPHVCSYKIQKAFFDILDDHRVLCDTIRYIHDHHPNLPVFLDAKVGDVAHTMDAYLLNAFERLNADGLVVNPYMGDEVLQPFRLFPDRAAIVLVRTSNPGASAIQDLRLEDGQPLWYRVLLNVVSRWNDAGNLIPVLASTAPMDVSNVRTIIPDRMPILLAGFGAQGGTLEAVKHLLNSAGSGVFINSSRGILYPYTRDQPNWRKAVLQAVLSMKTSINRERGQV